jgi:AraC family transcriptional regulator of adaptative response / DNA-3-methyladenine glycosylase II
VIPDHDTCYHAVTGRDARFDGWFFTAVRTTKIYCRPSCPAQTPKRENVTFYASAAAAQRNGYRACKRCRPDASPGSPEWDVRADLTGRALRLIADGVVDRSGVSGLADRLGYSERQLNRTLTAEVGAGPLALARAHRAQTARILLETTDLPAADVAFAAGFASVRQFNDTIREIFAETPTGLRARRRRPSATTTGTIDLRLAMRAPMDVDYLLRWLGWHAVPGVERLLEDADGLAFVRTLDLPHAPGRVRLRAGGESWVRAQLELTDQRDLTAAVSRVRHLLDLDADPQAVEGLLGATGPLGRLVGRHSGLRSPGAVDGAELAVRTVIGQQVSLAGASRVTARIVRSHGRSVYVDEPGWLFPSSKALAAADPLDLPMPRARARSLIALADACASERLILDPGVDRQQTRSDLLAMPGVGPWTAGYIAMRALRDPDVLLDTDLVVRRTAASLGIGLDPANSARWAPWRSYATHHLWAHALTAAAPTTRKDAP